MKAVYMAEPWSIAIKDMPEPSPKEGQALIKVHAAGICGSDIGAFRGVNNLVSYPRVIGHELSGEILSIPENNKKGLKPGDHVVVDPYVYCGKCYPCSIGRTNCCDDLKVLGVQTEGAMSERFAHPADLLVKIPDDMAWEDAALAEPLTISLHCIHRLRLKAGEHIAIFGAGPIGLLAAMAAIAYGAEPILIDLVEGRLDRCPVRGKVSDQSEDRRSDGENPGIHKRHALRVRSGSIRCKCRCALHAGCCLPRRADRLYRLATFGNFPADGSVHQKGTGSVRIQKQRRRI